MTAEHSATAGSLTRELVADVLAEFDRWAEHESRQAAGVSPDKESAARMALLSVKTELHDHLQIRLATTLATYGISPDGES